MITHKVTTLYSSFAAMQAKAHFIEVYEKE